MSAWERERTFWESRRLPDEEVRRQRETSVLWRCLTGRERLVRVYWGGKLVLAVLIGLMAVLPDWEPPWFLVGGLITLFMFLWWVACWCCAWNASWVGWGYIVRALVVLQVLQALRVFILA